MIRIRPARSLPSTCGLEARIRPGGVHERDPGVDVALSGVLYSLSA